MRITSVGLALLLTACASTTGSTPDPSSARTIALALLDGVARAWNRGWYKLMRSDSLVTRAPTSVVLIRNGGRCSILKGHTS